MDWSAFLSSLTGAAAAAGVVGVAFWKLLEKGIDAKLKAQDIELTAALHRQTEHYKSVLNAELGSQLEAQKTELAKSVHRQNAVFTRIHQQRSDVLQKLGEQISVFRWELMDFRPKSALSSVQSNDPFRDVAEWCAALMVSTLEPARTAFANSLLLPATLPLLMAGWHANVSPAVGQLMDEFLQMASTEQFAALTNDAKRAAFKSLKSSWDERTGIAVAQANNAMLNELRSLFDSVEHPTLAQDRWPVNSGKTS
ncbi:MAG: hypothetical protein QE290_03710 [Acidovorax sp.]|uniref:hypothetical protein n=1 Tax=Acidovorax sp. TaxID=1872122 RepID=UPI002619CDE3|nr:hypothetical protein [Acidovorax sp.]MDH4463126.1 hypothetical protein [Acidovorax sp.]